MTLLELTAAYAGVAANAFPGRAARLHRGGAGLVRLAVGFGKRSVSSARARGDGGDCCAARSTAAPGGRRCSTSPNFGKTGTSQDNRDALFVGYAGDLVVGVWIGNDDNTPLNGDPRRRAAGADLARLHGAGAGQERRARRGAAPSPTPDPERPDPAARRPGSARPPDRRHARCGSIRTARRSRPRSTAIRSMCGSTAMGCG